MANDEIIKHKTWSAAARDNEGREMNLRLAIEQTGQRGYGAYAYWNRAPENRDEMIIGTTEFAKSGPEAFRALRGQLESEVGLTLEDRDVPDWLMKKEWQECPRPSHRKHDDD